MVIKLSYQTNKDTLISLAEQPKLTLAVRIRLLLVSLSHLPHPLSYPLSHRPKPNNPSVNSVLTPFFSDSLPFFLHTINQATKLGTSILQSYTAQTPNSKVRTAKRRLTINHEIPHPLHHLHSRHRHTRQVRPLLRGQTLVLSRPRQ